jgi:PAS domain S-box-containing protein
MTVHGPASGLVEALEGSGDAVVATDAQGRIVAWNHAAEKVLGYRSGEVLGKPCYEVLDGFDACGARFCRRECELMRMTRRRESVREFPMSVRCSSGARIPATFAILAVRGANADSFVILHVLSPTGPGAEGDRGRKAAPRSGAAAEEALVASLTPRELEILRRLDEGESTGTIADALGIRATTVRTHVQHILRKLEVHTRLEAVALTLRRRPL